MPFKESQIICLEHKATCLYGEVIQLIPERGMCWFRPICMTVSQIGGDRSFDRENCDLIRLKSGSDLLWPTSLFRSALDTEVISLLVDSEDSKKSDRDGASRRYLNRFIREVWAANQDKF